MKKQTKQKPASKAKTATAKPNSKKAKPLARATLKSESEPLLEANVSITLDNVGRVIYSINDRGSQIVGDDSEISVKPGATVTFACDVGALAIGLVPVKFKGTQIDFRIRSAASSSTSGEIIQVNVPDTAASGVYKWTFTVFFDPEWSKKFGKRLGHAVTIDPVLRVYS